MDCGKALPNSLDILKIQTHIAQDANNRSIEKNQVQRGMKRWKEELKGRATRQLKTPLRHQMQSRFKRQLNRLSSRMQRSLELFKT